MSAPQPAAGAEVRPALAGDPLKVAEWALGKLQEMTGLDDAEMGIVVGAIDFWSYTMQLRELRRQDILAGESFCINCGCTESHGCEEVCCWALPNLCSRCANP